MKAIVLSPHNDDETLFAANHILREQPLVVVCFKSHLQELRGTGITAEIREAETSLALGVLGVVEWRQWPHLDSLGAKAELLKSSFRALAEEFPEAVVWAPVVENGGHEQHNIVGLLANAFWPFDQVKRYFTYRRGFERTYGERVEFEPHWPALKLRALACYESQIQEPSTRDWFLGEQWEYVPAA